MICSDKIWRDKCDQKHPAKQTLYLTEDSNAYYA